MVDLRPIRRDLVRGVLILLPANVCFLLAIAGASAAAISGPPTALRVLPGAVGAGFGYAGVRLYRRAWPLVRHPGQDHTRARGRGGKGGAGKGRAGKGRAGRPATGRPAGRRGPARSPESVRVAFARLAHLQTADQRTVTAYLLIGMPAVVAALFMVGATAVGGVIDLTGGTASIAWIPRWTGVVLQGVSLAGVVSIGLRGHRDPQVRFVAIALPSAVAIFSAMFWHGVVVPGSVLVLTVVVALAMNLAARRQQVETQR
jgi:hypothetical protein